MGGEADRSRVHAGVARPTQPSPCKGGGLAGGEGLVVPRADFAFLHARHLKRFRTLFQIVGDGFLRAVLATAGSQAPYAKFCRDL